MYLGGRGAETADGCGTESLLAALDPTLIQFCAINVHGVDKKDTVTSTRPKFVRINWVGCKVPAMKKMGALQGKQKIAEMWNGCSIEIDLSESSDKETLCNEMKTELLRCGGAHKPNSYDFGDHQIEFNFNTEGTKA